MARATAEKAWKRHALDKLADQILQDVRARCGDPQQWTDAQFIPHPSTYLNQRRWEDDPSVAAPNHGGNVIDADFGRLPRETQEAADAINAASAKRLGIKP
ncbi:hypothetical protein ASE10_09245 [Lysobacter sp. Root76]|nr:hypothetical protein ASE10_09245 [Lysobacter sp. Root76]KRD70552.1 hypothetical protein ASE45_01415 [Lysobacter sp. Root96]